MSKVTICDVCLKQYRRVEIKVKAKFTWFVPQLMSPLSEKYELCDDCWTIIEKACREKSEASKKR